MRLEFRNVTCGYGATPVAHDLSLEMVSGEVVCLLGPNGSGKTTLFKTILGFLRPMRGTITIDGSDISRWGRRRLAREIAYVPQLHTPSFPFRVLDVVMMGRTAHIGAFASPSRRDEEAAWAALEAAGMAHLAARSYTEISGGERQMILISRALVQEANLLILDEPTSNLDYGNQVRVLRHIRELAGQGIGILMTTHMPDHALLCADRCVLMHHGRIHLAGAPDDVITAQSLHDLYGVTARIMCLGEEDAGRVRLCVPEIEGKVSQ